MIEVTEEDKQRIFSKLPRWFMSTTGFKFSVAGFRAVVVGFGSFKKQSFVGNIPGTEDNLVATSEYGPTLVVAYSVCGSWVLQSIEYLMSPELSNEFEEGWY